MINFSYAGAALLTLTSTAAFAGSNNGYDHPHIMSGYGFGGVGMFMGPVFMLVLLATLVIGIVALIRWMAPSMGLPASTGNTALETLDMRLAQGELDSAEYESRKKLLLGGV